MTDALTGAVAETLARPAPPAVVRVAAQLSGPGVRAILFYGSILRTGDLDGVLDYYVLTDAPRPPAIWPEVSYREFADAAGTLRAKIATMPLATFASAARGETRDTTIWARFVQPAALVWVADEAARADVAEAVASAVATATRFAAALGPAAGPPLDYWRALFRATYAAEFRVEAGGRGDQIVDHDPLRYAAFLPLGWTRAGIAYREEGERLIPELDEARRRTILAEWARVRRWGKPLNVVRLVKAAFTFEGAGRYAAWKIERHTGVPVPLTPWQERHPILAAPGVLWRVRQARR
jgi:hypothetical protein